MVGASDVVIPCVLFDLLVHVIDLLCIGNGTLPFPLQPKHLTTKDLG